MPDSTEITGTFRTKDGLTLFTRTWRPPAEPRAVVALVHGYAEHSGRYGSLAADLVAEGHAVLGYDHRGFGRSEGRRAFIARFDDLLDDLDRFLDEVRQAYPDTPLFLFGHSMGGAVTALYALERRPERYRVGGAILSSPLFATNEAPLLQKIASVLGRIFPTMPTIPLDLEALSRDPSALEDIRKDPLFYHGRILARTGAEMIGATKRVRAQASHFSLPFLLFHGLADRLTDPEGSRRFFREAASGDKTLHLYEGLYHLTFCEPEKERVRGDVKAWLDTHVEAAERRG
ncbi:alpha/beta hydrolase [Rhodocaloribacter sp.]